MANFSLCVFTVAVLLSGATANVLSCMMKPLENVSTRRFILKPYPACHYIEAKFILARLEIQQCLGIETDISKMESLFHEFCTPYSDFRQKFNRQRFCLLNNLDESLQCVSTHGKDRNQMREKNVGKSINDICQSITDEMISCLRETVGGPCGEEGREVFGRMAEAEERLMKTWCLSIALFGGGSVALNDFEKNDVEWLKANNDPNAAMAVHSLAYCMLIVLLFTVNWWRLDNARLY